MTSVSWNV